tara:strand:+ start:4551 stop:4778 length:228 start_codon:yes stop_codon:yes gene_type:complete
MKKDNKNTETEQFTIPSVSKRYLVLKDLNNFKKGEIYKECYSTDGKNKRYYTKGLGEITGGNFAEHPELFELIVD